MALCKIVGWVKQSATQHFQGFVGFRSSTQPTSAKSILIYLILVRFNAL
ncbi:hypothetical protein GXM_00917 [Nostoc sphaeroides CCNUC1]|uniref:Uncharacterized protein n=1 Tax=Nostoc sphaeroides CCNUC1 TaxID=2653204 RepID=A0A5P8VSY8_9NOSO|nr:hypothetical protein GXM_00917 [Nostoc sphaeroides CCNUC1]